LCDATDMSRAQLQRRLDELLNDGKIRKTGKGRKGDAFCYFLDSAVADDERRNKNAVEPEGRSRKASELEFGL
jgi:hypothetical protein